MPLVVEPSSTQQPSSAVDEAASLDGGSGPTLQFEEPGEAEPGHKRPGSGPAPAALEVCCALGACCRRSVGHEAFAAPAVVRAAAPSEPALELCKLVKPVASVRTQAEDADNKEENDAAEAGGVKVRSMRNEMRVPVTPARAERLLVA